MRVSALRDVSKWLVLSCRAARAETSISTLCCCCCCCWGGVVACWERLKCWISISIVLTRSSLSLISRRSCCPSISNSRRLWRLFLLHLPIPFGALGSKMAEWGVEKMNLENRRSKRRLRATMSYLCWALLASMTSLARALRSLANWVSSNKRHFLSSWKRFSHEAIVCLSDWRAETRPCNLNRKSSHIGYVCTINWPHTNKWTSNELPYLACKESLSCCDCDNSAFADRSPEVATASWDLRSASDCRDACSKSKCLLITFANSD